MPASVNRLLASVPFNLVWPRPVYLAAGLVAFGALFIGGSGTRAMSASTSVAPLYPQTQAPAATVDASEYTVAQLVESLPMTERFGLLLSNTGVLGELNGPGPYTVFAPANNYFDYLPHDVYVGATRKAQRVLAEHHVVSGLVVPIDTAGKNTYLTLGNDRIEVDTPGDGSASVGQGYVVRTYHARNGVVYLINRVLLPQLQ